MSGINSLPGGGEKFSASRFKSKLKYLSKNSSALSPLSENQAAIAKAVSKYQGAIRQGKFSKSQQNSAISQIKKGGDLNSSQLRTVGKIISKLSEGGTKELKKSKVKINRASQDDLPEAKLAGSNKSSDMGNAAPRDYQTASTNRPIVSIHQRQEPGRGTGLANSNNINSRGLSSPPPNSSSRPSIPLPR